MKRHAERDLWYVIKRLRDKKDQCSSLRGVREVRIKVEEELAQEKCVNKNTVHRQLKFAAGVDKQGNAAALDLFLYRAIWSDNNEQR